MTGLTEELKVELGNILDIDPSKIDSDTPLVTYGIDSLSYFTIAFQLEDKYGVNIFSVDNPAEMTVRKAAELIEKVRTR